MKDSLSSPPTPPHPVAWFPKLDYFIISFHYPKPPPSPSIPGPRGRLTGCLLIGGGRLRLNYRATAKPGQPVRSRHAVSTSFSEPFKLVFHHTRQQFCHRSNVPTAISCLPPLPAETRDCGVRAKRMSWVEGRGEARVPAEWAWVSAAGRAQPLRGCVLGWGRGGDWAGVCKERKAN